MNKPLSQILIIEDDETLSNNLKTLLEEEGYEVITALNGESGIELAESLNPDLILCDIMMPGISGFDVKKELNKNENTFDIPLLFLTAKTELSALRNGMELGAEDYIFKPYTASNLLKVIKLRIEKSKRIIAKISSKKTEETESTKPLKNIFVNIGNREILLKVNSILAIQASNQYSNLILKNGKIILVRKSLNDWITKLNNENFTRIHRSTIINLKHLDEIEKNKVYLKDYDGSFEISRRYLSEIKKKS